VGKQQKLPVSGQNTNSQQLQTVQKPLDFGSNQQNKQQLPVGGQGGSSLLQMVQGQQKKGGQNGFTPDPKQKWTGKRLNQSRDFWESNYDTGDFLGQGAFGVVSKLDPKDKSNGQNDSYVAKTMPKKSAMREAKLMSRLPNHENLVNLEGYRREGTGQASVIMEMAERGDLEKAYALSGKMEAAREISEEERILLVKHFIKGSMSGMQAMHDEGWVHYDIKDENILLDENFTPQVTDFGLMNNDKKDVKPRGTTGFIAPEVEDRNVTQGSPEARRKSDVYSMGVTLKNGIGSRDADGYDEVLEKMMASSPKDRASFDELLKMDFFNLDEQQDELSEAIEKLKKGQDSGKYS
jgi:serine/threonine protein kinase